MKNLVRWTASGLFLLLPMFFGCGSASPPPQPRQAAVQVSPGEVTLGATETQLFTATVTNATNAAVTWTLSGCTEEPCGTISSAGLYTAPSLILNPATVTLSAAAQADPTKTDDATVSLMPIAVSIAPADVWVSPGTAQAFTASVRYDAQDAGVIWALGPACSATCGVLSNVTGNSVTYTAPAIAPDHPVMTLTATSVTDPSKKAERTIHFAAAGVMTEGDYAFVFNGWETPISNGTYWMYEVAAAGRFHADAQGNITNGVEDVNTRSGVSQAVPFTGTYSVGPDRRGSFTITTDQGTTTYHMVVDPSKNRGEFIRYDALEADDPIFGTGYFEKQDKAAFFLAALAGPYAFGMSGTTNGSNRLAAVGRFDVDASGAFSSGQADVTKQIYVGSDPQATSTDLELTGSLSLPSSSTGRGTATLTWGSSSNFAYYIISDQKILFVQTDTRSSTVSVLSGEARRQNGSFSATSFNAPTVFSMSGVNRSNYGWFYVNAAIGQMVPDQSGSVTGIIDDNQGLSNQAFTGSYTLDTGGRSKLGLQRGPGSADTYIAYFFNQNEAFLMQISGTDVLFGHLKPQAAGPFGEASITGTFRTHTLAPASEQAENDCGLTTFDGVGGITSTMDVNNFGDLRHFDFDGTYTVAPNGRGTLTFSAPSNGSAVFWVVSPTELVSIGLVDYSNPMTTLLQYER